MFFSDRNDLFEVRCAFAFHVFVGFGLLTSDSGENVNFAPKLGAARYQLCQ